MIEQRTNVFQGVLVQPELDQHKILFIIPAFNEEKCIAHVIDGIREYVSHPDILIVNDGSIDNTARVARRMGVQVLNMPHNLGIGGAVSAGLTLAADLGYAYVVRMDGDGQHSAEYIECLFDPVHNGQADVVFGARFCNGGKTLCTSWLRKIGIRFYGLIISLIIKQTIHDATSGFWCLNRKAICYFARYFPQDYPEVESHVLVYKAGMRQLEVPVIMRERISGRSSIGAFRSIYYVFKVLLAVCIRAIQEAPRLPEEEV